MNKQEHMPRVDRLKALLVGQSIVAATFNPNESPNESWRGAGPTGYLTLSNGTTLKVWGNDGGCVCGSGCYPLTHLTTVENIITNVGIDERPQGDGLPCPICSVTDWSCRHFVDGYYRIFVFAGDERINVASFEGSDGNGYYGTGWWLEVMEDAP